MVIFSSRCQCLAPTGISLEAKPIRLLFHFFVFVTILYTQGEHLSTPCLHFSHFRRAYMGGLLFTTGAVK